MKTLRQYIDGETPKRSDQQWADALGISRSHFTMLRLGTAQPGKDLMLRIEVETRGEVPILAWFADRGIA